PVSAGKRLTRFQSTDLRFSALRIRHASCLSTVISDWGKTSTKLAKSTLPELCTVYYSDGFIRHIDCGILLSVFRRSHVMPFSMTSLLGVVLTVRISQLGNGRYCTSRVVDMLATRRP